MKSCSDGLLELSRFNTRGADSELESYFVVSFEGNSDFGPYLSHLDFCVILLQSI